jgi:AcrR family transcriptional regulator
MGSASAPSKLAPAAPEAPVGRRARKALETRARLFEAAREVIASVGLGELTIADVTERADVGFGTFYGYFDSKDALFEGLVVDALERLGRANDARTADLDDPAEIVAVAVRQTMDTIVADPTFASFLVQVGFSGRTELWTALHSRMEVDVVQGQATGRFDASRGALSVHLLGGALLAAMRATVGGELETSSEAVAEASLVLLGLSADDAAEVAHRPMPAAREREER